MRPYTAIWWQRKEKPHKEKGLETAVVVKDFYLINNQYQFLLICFIRNPDSSVR